jgi:hypothetical protein
MTLQHDVGNSYIPPKTLPDTALNAGATVKKCDKKIQLRLLLRFLRGILDTLLQCYYYYWPYKY